MAATARQKRLYLHHQGEFQHNYYTFVSLHDSDHNGVVRISVDLSCELWGLTIYIIYINRGATALLVAVETPRLPRRSAS